MSPACRLPARRRMTTDAETGERRQERATTTPQDALARQDDGVQRLQSLIDAGRKLDAALRQVMSLESGRGL
jgi:hypothetical protein